MQGYQALTDKLRQYGSRKKKLSVGWGLSIIFAGLCVVLFVVSAGDRMLGLPDSARVITLAFVALAFAVQVAALVVIPFARRRSTRGLAAEVEDSFPELGDRLLSAVELAESEEEGVGSEALVRAVVEDAERSTENMDFTGACDTHPLARAMLILGLAFCLLAGYAMVHPLPLKSSLLRLFDPMGGHELYTYTVLEVGPGTSFVARGEPVEIRVKVSGAVPTDVAFHVRREGQGWRRHIVEPDREGEGSLVLENVYEEIRYSVRAGDARSPSFKLTPVDRPDIAAVTVTSAYPPYARLDPVVRINPVGGFSVAQGGEYSLSVTTSRPVERTWISSGDSIFEMSFSGEVWRSESLRPEESCIAEVFVEDGNGIRNPHPPRYSVSVTEDKAPVLTVERPEGDMAVLADAVVTVKVSATDDFGLVLMELPFVVVPGEDNAGRMLLASSVDEKRELEVEYRWDIGAYSLDPGARIKFGIEVVDNCEPEPGSSKSRVYTIAIMSYADHLDKLVKMQEGLASRLARVLKRQIECVDASGSIVMLNDEGLLTGSATSDIFSRADDENRISRIASGVARGLAELLEEMGKNRFVDEGSIVEVFGVREALRSLMENEAADTIAMLADAGSVKTASPRRKKLTTAVDTQEEIIDVLRDLIDRLQRDSELTKLVVLVQRLKELAERQRKVAADVGIVVPRTAGLAGDELPGDEKAVVDGLAGRESRLREGTLDLLSNMETVTTQLSFLRSDLAENVDLARNYVEEKDVSGRMADLKDSISRNKLFVCMEKGERIAADLDIAAKMLEEGDDDSIELLDPTELENLLKEQESLREELSKLGKDDPRLNELMKRQKALMEELKDALARARAMNKMLLGAMEGTVGNMGKAAGAMGGALSGMGSGDVSAGLSDQASAEEYLRKALKEMKELFAGQLEQLKKMSKAVRRLRRILAEQKVLAKGTESFSGEHGDGPHEYAIGMALKPIARRQRDVSNLTEALAADWPAMLPGGDKLEGAGAEMTNSADRLGESLTNEEARRSQKRAIEILEEMMEQTSQGAKGMAGMKMVPMLLAKPGAKGGGFEGGSDGDVGDKSLDSSDRDWSKLPPRVRESLLEGWKGAYPPEFRELLELYFERIRQ